MLTVDSPVIAYVTAISATSSDSVVLYKLKVTFLCLMYRVVIGALLEYAPYCQFLNIVMFCWK